MLSLINNFFAAIKEEFSFSSLNILLLQKSLNDNQVSENVIADVIDDLSYMAKILPLNYNVMSDVFDKHGIKDITSSVYNQLHNDSIALPYGSIGCP